jgi:hypothetical protein
MGKTKIKIRVVSLEVEGFDPAVVGDIVAAVVGGLGGQAPRELGAPPRRRRKRPSEPKGKA